ncbi:hypothetical protein A2U01_0036366, partial [Trifolium medium]|nr:hypothetical protein [Trifolium medium]
GMPLIAKKLKHQYLVVGYSSLALLPSLQLLAAVV